MSQTSPDKNIDWLEISSNIGSQACRKKASPPPFPASPDDELMSKLRVNITAEGCDQHLILLKFDFFVFVSPGVNFIMPFSAL
jgi:hypothetical protein